MHMHKARPPGKCGVPTVPAHPVHAAADSWHALGQVAALTQLRVLDLDAMHEPRLHAPALQLPHLPLLQRLRCWLPAKGGSWLPAGGAALAPAGVAAGLWRGLQLHDAFAVALVASFPLLQRLELLGSWDTQASAARPCALSRLCELKQLHDVTLTRNCFTISLDEL